VIVILASNAFVAAQFRAVTMPVCTASIRADALSDLLQRQSLIVEAELYSRSEREKLSSIGFRLDGRR
jgi:hypothetical protein